MHSIFDGNERGGAAGTVSWGGAGRHALALLNVMGKSAATAGFRMRGHTPASLKPGVYCMVAGVVGGTGGIGML